MTLQQVPPTANQAKAGRNEKEVERLRRQVASAVDRLAPLAGDWSGAQLRLLATGEGGGPEGEAKRLARLYNRLGAVGVRHSGIYILIKGDLDPGTCRNMGRQLGLIPKAMLLVSKLIGALGGERPRRQRLRLRRRRSGS